LAHLTEREETTVLSERQLILCELLVLRCQRRDDAAARQLVEMFQRPLLFYLRRLAAAEQDAWDLSQETWLAVFRRLKSLREPRAFPAYLYRTARNKALAYLRKRRDDPILTEMEQDEVEDVATWDPEQFLAEDVTRLRSALDALPLIHREALTLYFLDELSIDDTATVLGVPQGTVKSRLYHAKRALRKLLQPEEKP
jgi:RNA polymerase sigma-70 factor (ECF subfamily)